MTIGLVSISFVLSVAGVWIFRKLAEGSPRFLDIPNNRSSHSTPITRGAGIAIVLVVLGLYVAVFRAEANLAYIVASLIIAVVSFLDDLFSVPLLIRLGVHFGVASLFVYSSGFYSEISVPWSDGAAFCFGEIAPFVSILFIVWTINAFNFMDGIDGIAGAQAMGASIGWVLLGVAAGSSGLSFLGAILFGASAGFLVFNWQPAKVFMGDVGSTFLGFTFAIFPLIDSADGPRIEPWAFSATIIFLWLFLFDTIFTRFRQIASLQPFWRPHRDHLYQRVVLRGRPHQPVAAYFGVVAIAIALAFSFAGTISLFPLAILLILSPISLMLWAGKKD
ncbi:MAG: glycosyltransferase family 4 protein [Pyrinomonadaceae bacterium]